MKPGEISSVKEIKVSKVIYEGSDVSEIYWDDSDFALPNFESTIFTITSAEVHIISSNETALFNAEMFDQTYNTPIADRQLLTEFSWSGECPAEHPFYSGFSIYISSNEVLETVEAVAVITYTVH